MSSENEELERLDRIHDEQPESAAAGLLALDAAALDDPGKRTYAFLLNHVLGEKLGRWPEALARLAPLAAAADAPLVLLRQHAVAAHCAGERAQAEAAIAKLAARAGAEPESARLLVEVAALSFGADARKAAPRLAALATRASGLAAGALDAAFAASFNNATNALYYATREAPVTAVLASALRGGAEAALVHWLRAGGWIEHERAHYLCAKVALRLGEPAAAIAHAERALAIVSANGGEPAERAFLLQLLAAGVERSGWRERAAALRAEAAALPVDTDTRALLAQDAAEFPPLPAPHIAFVGGGNMAGAMIGGLRRAGAVGRLHVVEIDAARRDELQREYGARTAAAPDAALTDADVIVLAVKPQQMREACRALRPFVGSALLLSIAAGIRAADIARWTGSPRVVRAMPNTPALIGLGVAGAAALSAVDDAQRALAERVLAAAGEVVWFDDEAMLDPVTAVSGSGPAYVFAFIEALQAAGERLGFSAEQSRRLAVGTFVGAAQLAAQSGEPVAVLRERVTSKGGTTAAALARMQADDVAGRIVAAVEAANARARELGDELGGD